MSRRLKRKRERRQQSKRNRNRYRLEVVKAESAAHERQANQTRRAA